MPGTSPGMTNIERDSRLGTPKKTWMAGINPAMTGWGRTSLVRERDIMR